MRSGLIRPTRSSATSLVAFSTCNYKKTVINYVVNFLDGADGDDLKCRIELRYLDNFK